MRAALALWWRLRQADTPDDAGGSRGLDALAVTAYTVATAALLITLGGVHAFVERNATAPDDLSGLYVALAVTAAGLLVVPILTLGGVAARLSLRRRDSRLATLRLGGATSGQVSAMVLAESAAQASTGAVLGAAAYGLAIPGLSLLSFQGRTLGAGEVWLGLPAFLGATACVVLLSIVSGLSSLAAVVVGPLGVARRTTPGRLRLWRLLVGAGALGVWMFGMNLLSGLGTAVIIAVLVAVVASVNLVGPLFVQIAGRIHARRARTAAGLVAARRIVDDPRATWRSVSALSLAICVAALSSFSSVADASSTTAADRILARDMGTGALVALAIVTVVAATSTGVVQAARVIDQRAEYRALALAGTPLPVLHRCRTVEVAIPLAVTTVIGSGLPLLILVPLSSLIGPGVLVRTALALAVSVLALAGSVQLSRGLLERYADPARA